MYSESIDVLACASSLCGAYPVPSSGRPCSERHAQGCRGAWSERTTAKQLLQDEGVLDPESVSNTDLVGVDPLDEGGQTRTKFFARVMAVVGGDLLA